MVVGCNLSSHDRSTHIQSGTECKKCITCSSIAFVYFAYRCHAIQLFGGPEPNLWTLPVSATLSKYYAMHPIHSYAQNPLVPVSFAWRLKRQLEQISTTCAGSRSEERRVG